MHEISLAEQWGRIFQKMEDASEKFARCDREMARRAAAERKKGERDEKGDTAG